MKNAKIVVNAVATKNANDRLVLVKRGEYNLDKAGIAKALADAFVDKYRTFAPAFKVTDMSQIPAVKRGEMRFAVVFKKGRIIFGLGGVEYNAEVSIKGA